MDTSRLYEGEIPELYHQTSATSLGDMTLDKRGAVAGDNGMPEGIFLKENANDIGLRGKNQLALNAKMERPAYFKDRADLEEFMRSRGAGGVMKSRREIDAYYQNLSDQLEKKFDEANKIYWANKTPENKAVADEIMAEWQKALKEWTSAVDSDGEVSREGIRNTLVNNGYDGAIIEKDVGSGGRSVKSYVAFDKEQLSPRYNKDMNFDPEDAKSVFNEAKKRQNDLDLMMSNIAESISAGGDKAVYKSGGNKSIESMLGKTIRKREAGRDYRLMDMKDHMRGAVMLEDLNAKNNEIEHLLDGIKNFLGKAPDVEAIETDLGYTGLHLTWRDADGLGYEIQVTTPEVWKTKKASDKLYKEVRNWTAKQIKTDPAKKARLMEVEQQSKALWDNFWNGIGGKPSLKKYEGFGL